MYIDTLNSLIDRLNNLQPGDPESAHALADAFLVEALFIAGQRDAGVYRDVAKAYLAAMERVGFWYA